MSTITLHQAMSSDIDAVAPLFDEYRQFYGREPDVEAARAFLLARFNQGDSVVFVAREDGMPAGFVQLYPTYSSILLARTFILNDIFVSTHHRRRGIGARLLSASVEYAQRVGAARLSLSTATSNDAAQSLYEAAGWKRDDQFFVYHYVLSPTCPLSQGWGEGGDKG